MTTVLLLIHLFVTLALIGVVLIQRSEGGGLGIGTSQGMGSFMSGRGTANLLTRATAVLGTIFMLLSLTLALMNRGTSGIGRSILDVPPTSSGSLAPGAGAGPTGAPVPGPNTPGSGAADTAGAGSPAGSGPTGSANSGSPTAPATGAATPPPAPPPAQGPSVPTN